MPTSKTVTAVERTVKVIELLDTSRRGHNISEISRRLHIPKSSTHLIVATLAKCGYVAKDSRGHYGLGMRAVNLGRETMRELSLAAVSREPMQWLAAQTQLTIHLAVLIDDQAMFVQKVDAPGLIRFDTYPGKRTNLHCTALGKVLLAFGPEIVRRRYLSRETFAQYTAKTITEPSALKNAIDQVVKHGFAIDNEEEEIGVRCVAVTVMDQRRQHVAALSASGLPSQITLGNRQIERLVGVLGEASARITSMLEEETEQDGSDRGKRG